MLQNMENIDFRTCFTLTSQQWSLLKWNCDFLVPWNISEQKHRTLCPKLLYVLRECAKSLKIRPRGTVPPWSMMHLLEKQLKIQIRNIFSPAIIRNTVLTFYNLTDWFHKEFSISPMKIWKVVATDFLRYQEDIIIATQNHYHFYYHQYNLEHNISRVGFHHFRVPICHVKMLSP